MTPTNDNYSDEGDLNQDESDLHESMEGRGNRPPSDEGISEED